MKKKPEIFLKHILGSIGDIEKYTKGISREKFSEDTQIQDAAIRKLEIIGEAVKNLPAALKRKHRNIPWEKIAGTRNILIHEYFGVDLKLVWRIIKKDLPELKNNISKILKDEELAS